MKHRSTRRSLGIIWLGTTLALVLTLWSGQVQAVDKSWNGGTVGDWNSNANWNPLGVPAYNDNVYLTKNDASSWGVYYYPVPLTQYLNNYYMYNAGTGTIRLYLGYWSDTSSLNAVNEYIGVSGKAEFFQKGARNACTLLDIGSKGTYSLGGGTLDANQINLASGGVFSQSDGIFNQINPYPILYSYSMNISGVYSLSGGSMSVYSLTLNSGGKFNHSGGSLQQNSGSSF